MRLAGLGCEAVDHFILQHEVHVLDLAGKAEQMEDQRRRDVVGQVADNAQQAVIGAQAGEVELERVGLMDLKAVFVTEELGAQHRDQIPVEFDRLQSACFFQQLFGERAKAGADLHQMLVGLGVDGTQYAPNDAGVVQKVLAKALARLVHGRFFAHRWLSWLRWPAAIWPA